MPKLEDLAQGHSLTVADEVMRMTRNDTMLAQQILRIALSRVIMRGEDVKRSREEHSMPGVPARR